MSYCIFFPFSHISKQQLDTLQAFFTSFAYFPAAVDLNHQPELRDVAGEGLINPLFSSKEDLSIVDQTFNQYMSWVKLHRGNEDNLKYLLKKTPHFTSDSDLPAIKSQIRGTHPKLEPRLNEKERLYQDLVFLKIARHWDQNNEAIDSDLRGVDQVRTGIFSDLLGEDNLDHVSESGGKPLADDPGATMTRERVAAFARCLNHSKVFETLDSPPLFITTSEAVVDYLETISSDVINALDIGPIKVHENECKEKTEWQRQVLEQLEYAGKNDAVFNNGRMLVTDGCSAEGQITLKFFSGNKIPYLFHLKDEKMRVCLIRLK